MAKDKFKPYKVLSRIYHICAYVNREDNTLCCKYILNDIDTETMLKVINITEKFKSDVKEVLLNVASVDSMNTEQLACLYVALYALDDCGYFYATNSNQYPVSMRLNQEIIDMLIKEMYITRSYAHLYSKEVSELINIYPILGPRKKFGWVINSATFLIFADLWSRATNQIMSLDLFLMLE